MFSRHDYEDRAILAEGQVAEAERRMKLAEDRLSALLFKIAEFETRFHIPEGADWIEAVTAITKEGRNETNV